MNARDAEFSDFVVAHQGQLRKVGYALCGEWHTAEDLLQTALTKLYVAWPRVQRRGQEVAYVRTIMVRANIDEHRRPWRRERVSELLPERAGRDETGAVDDHDAIFTALQQLPEMQRKVVVLRHWLGLSVAETAAELGIGEGTVKSHASRGAEKLRAVLAPQ